MHNSVVLLIEDDEYIRQTLAEFLKLEGVSAVTASDGHQALELLKGGLMPDLILTDHYMPIMSGTEFIAAKNEVPLWNRIPTVLMTAAHNIHVRVDALITKPFNLDALLNVIDTYCSPDAPAAAAV